MRISLNKIITYTKFALTFVVAFAFLSNFNILIFVFFALSENFVIHAIQKPMSLFTRHQNDNIPATHYSLTLFLYEIMKENWMYFAVYLVGMIIQSQHTTIYSTLFGRILDTVQQGQGLSWENGIMQVLMYFLAGVVLSTAYAATTLLSAHLNPWMASRVRGYYLKYIIAHSYYYFSETLTGDILTKINNLTGSCLRIVRFFVEEFIPVMILSCTTLFIFMSDYPQFQHTLLAWIVLHFGIFRLRLTKYVSVALNNAKQYTVLMGVTGNIFQNIFAIKFLASQDFEKKYFDKYQDRDIESYKKMLQYNANTEIIMDSCCYLFFLSFVFIFQITTAYMSGVITLGMGLSIYNILRSVSSQVWRTTENTGDLMLEISRAKDAMQLLQMKNRPLEQDGETELKSSDCEQAIEFRNIYFYYNTKDGRNGDESYLFEDFNLSIKRGTKVAFVGSSGSGKSTLTTLLLRLVDPIKGTILVNDQDISNITKTSLRNKVSFIPQAPFLFNRPLFENIGYGCPEIREMFLSKSHNIDITFEDLPEHVRERIVGAAEKSSSHDFIISLPNGYNSVYGRDLRLSGGQQQRLMIARAFINDQAEFLVLDEATSALDPDTEKSIRQSVKMIGEGKTMLVIAHKLNTIFDSDRIIVFEKGRIIQDGTHESLLEQGGKYSQMWESQTKII